MKKNQLGFTLIELVVTIVLTTTILGIVMFNFLRVQRQSSVNTITDVLISDMSSQQTKAMQGVGTASGTNYGIYFQSNKYTLFQGNSYNASDSKNYTVNLDSGYTISNITFPSNTLLFTSATGTVSGYLNGNTSVTIQDQDGLKLKTVTVNRYGVVIGYN